MDMNQPIGATPLDGKPDGLVGRPIDRIDGRLKVTGRAPYAYETRDLKNPAYGFLVEAGIAKGRIRSLDVSAAKRAPGVLRVVTHLNALKPAPAPGSAGGQDRSFRALQSDRIVFNAQPVALVVAVWPARKAARMQPIMALRYE